jgi:hypothetical protein
MKYLIGNTVINGDHIVCVRYDPERIVTDDETGNPYPEPSRVTITLSAINHVVAVGYGVGSKSQTIEWIGDVADAFWAAYSGDAYKVVS